LEGAILLPVETGIILALHSVMNDHPAYPEGETLQAQINKRHWRGTIWRVLFQISTIVGIVALTALLYNILNESFGLMAVQNSVEPASLVLVVEEEKILTVATLSSEDDNELAAEIIADPYAIGFFGYAYYKENSDDLKILSINDIEAAAETAASGTYPLARPLFMVTSADILQQNQAASVFINYTLTNIRQRGLRPARLNWPPANGRPSTRKVWEVRWLLPVVRLSFR
jgi:hypothetical protein